MTDNYFYHPELLANVFPSKFCTINFKSWLYVREKFLGSEELRARSCPPWEDCPGDPLRELPASSKVVNFESPMDWPTFVNTRHGMEKARYAMDWIWEQCTKNPLLEIRNCGAEFSFQLGLFFRCDCTIHELRKVLFGVLEPVHYKRGEELHSEIRVYKEYSFNSILQEMPMWGLIAIANHSRYSSVYYDTKKSPTSRALLSLSIPVYSGKRYINNFISNTFFCEQFRGVSVFSRSHSKRFEKDAQFFINYFPGDCQEHGVDSVDWPTSNNFIFPPDYFISSNLELNDNGSFNSRSDDYIDYH